MIKNPVAFNQMWGFGPPQNLHFSHYLPAHSKLILLLLLYDLEGINTASPSVHNSVDFASAASS
jgi:hypothetical protein